MQKGKSYLFPAVVIGILCTSALSKVESPTLADESFLISQINPTLAGIKELCIVILPSDNEPNKDGLARKELLTKVEQKLRQSGVKINPGIAGDILNIPELRVYVDMLKPADSQQYVFRIEISLARKIVLPEQQKLGLKADVWKTEPIMEAVSVENMPARVTDAVLKQVEAFIGAYLTANPAGAKTDDVASQVPQKEQAKPQEEQRAAKYQYVASKNSKVFHKSECSSAKRISPENIVGYTSREEAMAAGKRPCKLCNP
jgi:hypothetical protein